MNLRNKKIIFLGIILFILFFFVNFFSYLIINNQFGISIYDHESYQKRKNSFKKDTTKPQLPHPYFGLTQQGWEFIPNILTTEPLFSNISEIRVENPIKVLILGGSVASDMSSGGAFGYKHLFSELLNSYFKTQNFTVYNAAFGGGKQPQQYFKLMYLDLLGFRPDIVINLDGFNEIALPLSENKSLGIPAIFPRSYSRLLHSSTSDRSCASFSNKLLNLNTKLPFTELLIWLYVRNCHYKIEGTPYDVPWWSSAMGITNSTNYVDESIAIWEQSSNKINEALLSRGIDYIHVLQPNQYLEGSKTLTGEEKEKYLNYEIFGKPIKENYSKLSNINLATSNFIDQRFLFLNTSYTVYVDNCCHFNKIGMTEIINDIIKSNENLFRKHLIKN